MKNSAKNIYQYNLDQVSHAFWTRNVYLLLEHVALPIILSTEDRRIVAASTDEVSLLINEFRDYLDSIGAQCYVRRCTGAAFVPGNPDMIVGQHETLIMRGGQYAIKPYLNDMTVVRIDNRWQVTMLDSGAKSGEKDMISADLSDGQKREHMARDLAAAHEAARLWAERHSPPKGRDE